MPEFLFHWEYILIGIGIYILSTSRNKTAGIILIAIGLFNLFPEFWPLVLVGLGIYIILKRNRSNTLNMKNNFGESAPAGQLFEEFGFTAENVGKAIDEVTA